MGNRKAEWQDVNKVLGLFNRKVHLARKQYHAFVVKGIEMGRRPDLIGGGLIRSTGGWQAVKALGKNKIHLKGDERILGDSDFVLKVFNEKMNERTSGYEYGSKGMTLKR
jgi:putative transposase